MVSNDYFAAAYPEPFQVLGLTLRPFSLGHYLKLRRLGCAFVAEEETGASLGDLLLGVAVCSMPTTADPAADPFWTWLQKPPRRWRRWIARWFKREPATPSDVDIARWGKKCGMIDVAEKAKLFNDYIKLHSVVPPYWEEPQPGVEKKSGAHWSQAVLHTLTSKCGYSQEEALNVPLSRALADFFKHAESEGAVRLMTEQEARLCCGE